MLTKEVMTNTIELKKIGSSLGTRNLGAKVRMSILEKIATNEKIFLDFDQVDVVSNSFANECFGKLRIALSDEVFKSKITFINTNDFIQRIIISAL